MPYIDNSVVQAHMIKSIDIVVEQESKDYHDLVLDILESLITRLYGGHYEPCSNRDKELADSLLNFLNSYKGVQ